MKPDLRLFEHKLDGQRDSEHEALLNRINTVLPEAGERIKQANKKCNDALKRLHRRAYRSDLRKKENL